jgi:hypothetical protein
LQRNVTPVQFHNLNNLAFPGAPEQCSPLHSAGMAESAVIFAVGAAFQVSAVVQSICDVADTVKANKKDSLSLALYVRTLHVPLQRRASASPDACQLVMYELTEIEKF